MTDVVLGMYDLRRGRKPSALSADEKRHIEDYMGVYDAKIEEFLNVLNVACGMYRDSRLDRKRFRVDLEPEIRRLFDDDTPNFREKLHSMNTPYNALRAVFKEWFNPEE